MYTYPQLPIVNHTYCINYMCHCLRISLPTGCTRIGVCASILGCLFGTMFVLDVAFLSWSSFKFDAVQDTNG